MTSTLEELKQKLYQDFDAVCEAIDGNQSKQGPEWRTAQGALRQAEAQIARAIVEIDRRQDETLAKPVVKLVTN